MYDQTKNPHLYSYRDVPAIRNIPGLDDYYDVRELHDVVFNSYEPLIRHHWAKAHGVETLERVQRLDLSYPLTLTLEDVNDDTERFNHFRFAVLYDTMRRTSDETTGGDDSTFDYAPDGAEQVAAFINPESFQPLVQCLIRHRAFQPDVYMTSLAETIQNESGPYLAFMDCTSPLFTDTIARLSA